LARVLVAFALLVVGLSRGHIRPEQARPAAPNAAKKEQRDTARPKCSSKHQRPVFEDALVRYGESLQEMMPERGSETSQEPIGRLLDFQRGAACPQRAKDCSR